MKRHEEKLKKRKLTQEGQEILLTIEDIKKQLEAAQRRFNAADEEALIDWCIYEILALQSKYAYFLKTAKDMGIMAGGFEKIG